jgi:hypothetical protein
LAERLKDCQAKVLITADGAWRGEKLLLLKTICDEALEKAEAMGHHVNCCIVVSHMNRVTPGKDGVDTPALAWNDERDFWWHEEMENVEASCYPEWMAAEDPLFLLYTSMITVCSIPRLRKMRLLYFSQVDLLANRKAFCTPLLVIYCTLRQHSSLCLTINLAILTFAPLTLAGSQVRTERALI